MFLHTTYSKSFRVERMCIICPIAVPSYHLNQQYFCVYVLPKCFYFS